MATETRASTTWLIGLELVLPSAVLLFRRLAQRRFSAEAILVCPALLAPLALVYPWAAMGGHLGIALGGPELFLEWLTRHPDLGPVNSAVLIGLLCILGSSLLPAALGVYWQIGGRRRPVLVALAAGTLIVYLPVLVRLDLVLWLVRVFDAQSQLEAACGPLIRALAAGAAVAMALRAHFSRITSPPSTQVSPSGARPQTFT